MHKLIAGSYRWMDDGSSKLIQSNPDPSRRERVQLKDVRLRASISLGILKRSILAIATPDKVC
jgi:hypothetical protein